ncbi:hypothetical protein ACFV3R_32280 [Streptomyces sp. NPDC059740]|uniref:hypothetical protein n=1 Tax=Streptomyces sp. NPDC059740 TaxID=3346926 RepID=UPI00364F1D7E
MPSSSARPPAEALAWVADQLRHISPAARVSQAAGAFDVRFPPSRPARVHLVCCWHEPRTEKRLGIAGPVSLSALYTLELLDLAAREPSPQVTARFIPSDSAASRAEAIAAGRRLLDAPGPRLLVVVAAGGAAGGGLFPAGALSAHEVVDLALPAMDGAHLGQAAVRELAAGAREGITACVLDPVQGPGELLAPQELWAALRAQPAA